MHLINDYLIERELRTRHIELRRIGLDSVRAVRQRRASTTRRETQ